MKKKEKRKHTQTTINYFKHITYENRKIKGANKRWEQRGPTTKISLCSENHDRDRTMPFKAKGEGSNKQPRYHCVVSIALESGSRL